MTEKWIGFTRVNSDGNKFYLEVQEGDSEIVFVKVRSQIRVKHLGETRAFSDYHMTDRCKLSLEDFLDICREEYGGQNPFSRVDFTKAGEITPQRLNRLITSGSLQITKDGSVLIGQFETVV